MNTLIIDCSAGMSIILLTDSNCYKIIDNNQKKHTDELLLSVDKLLNEAGISIKSINNICVCVGPGSFTGIRVAISICKGLAIGISAKVFTASNFDIYSFNDKEKAVYILEAFSDFVYVRIFDGESYNDSCIHFSDLLDNLKSIQTEYKIFVSSEKIVSYLNDNGINSEPLVNKTIELFKKKIDQNDSTLLSHITPIYLRASQAEIERNERLKREKSNVLQDCSN